MTADFVVQPDVVWMSEFSIHRESKLDIVFPTIYCHNFHRTLASDTNDCSLKTFNTWEARILMAY